MGGEEAEAICKANPYGGAGLIEAIAAALSSRDARARAEQKEADAKVAAKRFPPKDSNGVIGIGWAAGQDIASAIREGRG